MEEQEIKEPVITEQQQPQEPVKENPIQVNLVKEYARLSEQIDNINKRLAEADKPKENSKIEKDILI